jgi:capsular polysaccharide biosynthesis protein
VPPGRDNLKSILWETEVRQSADFRSTWLWQFCLRHLKRNRPLYLLAHWILRKSTVLYYLIWIYVRADRLRPIVPLAPHVAAESKIRLIASETVSTPAPAVLPFRFQTYLVSPHEKYEFPEIYLATVSNALVTGGTNLLMVGNTVVCHDLHDFRKDYTSEELHRRTFIRPDHASILWLMPTDVQRRIPKAACFTDACSGNYAHWITEVLPRINLFCLNDPANIPLIVNHGLHPNLTASLLAIAGSQREIIALAADANIAVDKLSVVSVTGYVPFERRTRKADDHSHGMFSRYGLTSMRDRLRESLVCASRSTARRIVIRRNSGVRNIVNQREIEEILTTQGFTVVEPERLTFAEQVELFANAEVVVGATGAAFANIVFCSPSAKIIIMIPIYRHTSYWYWQNIACAVGNRITYVLGKITKTLAPGIHSDFYVNPSDVLDAIRGK